MFKTLKDILFPKYCISCNKYGLYLCPQCISKIAFCEKIVCPNCQRPAVNGTIHAVCRTRYSLDGIVSLYQYKDSLKKFIKNLKYGGIFDVKDELDLLFSNAGSKISANTNFWNFLQTNPLIVPVPLHRKRENERGFNQAEIISLSLAEKYSLKVAKNLIFRIKNTHFQAELDKKNRIRNVRGAFELNSSALDYLKQCKNLLLVDDVWTTGSTLSNICAELKKHRAEKVWALTLAY